MHWRTRLPALRMRLDALGCERWLSRGGPEHEDERILELERARDLLRRCELDWHRADVLLRDLPLGRSGPCTPDATRAQLERALLRGQLYVLERPLAVRTRELPLPLTPAPLEPPEAPPPESTPEAQAWLELTVLDAQHCPLPGLELQLTEASARVHRVPTDLGGHRAFVLQGPGPCSLSLDTPHELDWPAPADAPIHLPDDAPQYGRYLSLLDETFEPIELDSEAHAYLLLDRPLLRLPTPHLLYFDHDSALLAPGPWVEAEDQHPLAAFVHSLIALVDHPERHLFVLGRASASGSADHNQELSEARALGLQALAEHDVDAWVDLAEEHRSRRDTFAYFDYLARVHGWSCTCATPIETLDTPAKPNTDTRACVRAFQDEFNQRFGGKLAKDGVCGRKTLRAMFQVQRDEFERWLAKLGLDAEQLAPALARVRYGGCGVERAQAPEGSQDERLDRAVDLFLYEGQDDPRAIPFERLYTSTLPRRLPFPLPHEPKAWATGPFTIVSDLTEHESFESETYRLSSDDGRIQLERRIPEDAQIEAGEYVLHYPELPTDARYTLVVIAASGNESPIFSNLSYGQLHPGPETP